MTFKELVKHELDFQRSMLRQYRRLAKIKEEGLLICKHRRSGKKEYYIRRAGTEPEYVNKQHMERVHRMQMKALGEAGAEKTELNVAMLEDLLKKYDDRTVTDLAQDLPVSYRPQGMDEKMWLSLNRKKNFPQSENPKYREHLIHSTTFGLMVRSKNESQIAEKLMVPELEFYYERALALRTPDGRDITVYPDFTICLPDGRVVYWEHAGMLGDPEYAKRHCEKLRLYYYNGIYEPKNLIVTCDGPDGEFAGVEIGMIIEKILTEMVVKRL